MASSTATQQKQSESNDSSSSAAPTFAVHIKGFPSTTTESDIQQALSKIGQVLPSSLYKISRGYAIIDFSTKETANKAVDASEKINIAGAPITISAREGHTPKPRRPKQSNGVVDQKKRVYVIPIPKETSQEEIKNFFSSFGEVSSASIRSRKDETGFAFVTFATEDAAAKAVAASGSLTFKGENVSLEFRKSGKKPKKARKPKAAKAPAAASTTESSKPAAHTTNGASAEDGKKKKRKPRNKKSKDGVQAKAASTDNADNGDAEQLQDRSKSLHIKTVPLNTTADAITEAFSKIGPIVNTSLKISPATVYLDYATQEEREAAIKKAIDASKEEKKGSFGTAILKPFRSRGKKDENTFSMGVRGFKDSQTPTEDDIQKIFSEAPISRITILPPKAFAFVDFDDVSALEKALSQKTTLPGSSEPLEVEKSKPASPRVRTGGRRFGKPGAGRKAAEKEAQ